MHRTTLGALAPTLLAAALSVAAPARAEDAPSLPHERFVLDNGMEVLLLEDHAVPQVVTVTWYRVGSKDEPEGRTGFAHLFEHLMFKGSAHIPDGKLDLILEEGGGWSNAFTSSDMTVYFNTAASNFLETMLWIEGDRLAGLMATFDQAKLDNQRDVVRNERRQRNENEPYGMSNVLLREALWPAGHGYHWPVIGYHADLQAAGVEDVQRFFEQYYVPANATLVIAGDFDPAEAKALAARYLGWIPAGGAPERPQYADPEPIPAPVQLQATDQVQVPKVFLAWRGPRAYAEDEPAMALAARLLGGGKTSRLYQRLVYRDRLAQEVSAGYEGETLGGEFTVEVLAKPGVAPERLREAVLEELARLGAEPPGAPELQRAQNANEAGFLGQLEPVLWRAIQLAAYEVLAGDADYLAEDLARYQAVTPEAVSRAVQTWLDPQRRVELVIGPEGPEAAPGEEVE